MRSIDCGHSAGIEAPVAVALADMVAPQKPWLCPEEDEGVAAAAITVGENAKAGTGGGGLSGVLQDAGGVSAWGGSGDGVIRGAGDQECYVERIKIAASVNRCQMTTTGRVS